jgi:hypothetical protein
MKIAWIIAIGLWPALVLGIWALRNSLRDSKNETIGIKSINWPETTGTILSSEALWGHLEVQFGYTVNGKEFNGKYTVGLDPIVPNRSVGGVRQLKAWQEETSELVNSYPVGSRVVVRYNPERPEESVLYCSAEPVNRETPDGPQFQLLDEK